MKTLWSRPRAWMLVFACSSAWLLSACASARPDALGESLAPTGMGLRVEISTEDEALQSLLQEQLNNPYYQQLRDLSAVELQRLARQIRDDAQQILRTQGYFQADIALASLPEASSGGQILRLTLSHGARTRVAQVAMDFEGAIDNTRDAAVILQRRQIRHYWDLPVGEVFTQNAWDAAKSKALTQLTAKRYLAGVLQESRAKITPSGAQLQLDWDSGPPYAFGPLAAQGLQRFSPLLLERLARIPVGQSYDAAELLKAQQRISDSGFFESVYLRMLPQEPVLAGATNAAPAPIPAPVIAQVGEAKLQKAVLGVGGSTNNGPRLSFEHTHNLSPFFDWRSQSKFSIDRRAQALSTELLSQPSESYWRTVLGAGLSRERDVDQTTDSKSARFGRIKVDDTIDRSFYLEYNTSRYRYFGVDAPAFATRDAAVSVNWAWTLKNFDQLVAPSSGWGLGLEVSAGATVGDEAARKPYTRTVVRGQWIVPLRDESRALTTNSSTNTIHASNVSNALRKDRGRIVLGATVAGVGGNQSGIPQKLLFLTGGDNTVRGYDYRSIGADVDQGGTRINGEPGGHLYLASLEWQRPIYRAQQKTAWESAVFVDTGAVADRVADLRAQTGVGIGARWRSPVGPFQMDLARGLATGNTRLHFSLGFVF